ncbi:MAG: MBL fold metallo-hydrolase [Propionibacteriaceae bacterium]|jgi:L-ascorbate metabolism protein UlaG (beta-lactamase superfamily)|nr:MBL fold metallo-hydrolase [Propionibacteriaceae bacterium]
MKVTHLGHSAVLVEAASTRLLLDPGNFSNAWHGLTDLTAVVVTHQHPDHVDPEHLPALLQANPSARLLTEPQVAEVWDLPRAEPVSAGETMTIGDVTLSAVGGTHAVIHRDIPVIGNIGVVVESSDGRRFFHPGDSLDAVPAGVDVAAIPAHGPWCAMKEIIDFARALAAPRGFLIHEGLVNERGWALSFGRIGAMSPTELTDLRGGGSLDV